MWNVLILQNILVLGHFRHYGLLVKHLSMLEPVSMQIAATFTKWRCKSRGTPGYSGTPVYRVLHHIYSFKEIFNQIRFLINAQFIKSFNGYFS